MKVVISGSFRKYLKEIAIALKNFKKSDVEVLAPITGTALENSGDFVFLTTDDSSKTPDILEREFMDHIKEADFLYVVNTNGYVGQSVATEMAVAVLNGVLVILAEPIVKFSDEILKEAQVILKTLAFQRLPIFEISSENVADFQADLYGGVNLSPADRQLLESLVECLLKDLAK